MLVGPFGAGKEVGRAAAGGSDRSFRGARRVGEGHKASGAAHHRQAPSPGEIDGRWWRRGRRLRRWGVCGFLAWAAGKTRCAGDAAWRPQGREPKESLASAVTP